MDMNRVSACSYALHDQDLDNAIRIISEAGFGSVDLWGRSPHFSTHLTEVKPRDIEKITEKYSVKIANLGTYCGGNFLDNSRPVRQKEMSDLCRAIDLAKRFGARSIRVSPGAGNSPQIVEALVDYFGRAAVYAASKGIRMGMENHAGSIAGDPDIALKLCEGVSSRFFGILYDPCNLFEMGQDYKQALGMLKNYIMHIHLKDGKWVEGKFQRCHLGEGEIDIPWILNALNEIGYEGHIALEYEAWEIEPVETGLQRWYKWFEQLSI